MNLASNLKYLRSQKGWSQKDLGNYVDKGASAVSMWEKGNNEPPIDILRKLSELYEVTIDDLVNKDLTKQAPSGRAEEVDPAIYRVVARLQRQLEEAEAKLAAQPTEKNIRELRRIRDALIKKYPDTARELGIIE